MEPGEVYFESLGISNHHRSYSDTALYNLYHSTGMMHPYSNENAEGSSGSSSPRDRPNSYPCTQQSLSSSSSSFYLDDDVDDGEGDVVDVDDYYDDDADVDDDDGADDDDDDDDESYYGDDEEEVDETGEDDIGSVSVLSDGASSSDSWIESYMKRKWQEFRNKEEEDDQ